MERANGWETAGEHGTLGFPEWALRELERLMEARAAAGSAEERALFELQIAVICDAASRYGRSLHETAEL